MESGPLLSNSLDLQGHQENGSEPDTKALCPRWLLHPLVTG